MTNLEAAIKLLDKIGTDWRNDWSDFDGRTLFQQLNGVIRLLEWPNKAYLGEIELD